MLDDYILYDVFTTISGDNIVCPACDIGILLEAPDCLVCDVCDATYTKPEAE